MGRDLLIRSQILRDLFVFARSGPAGLSFRWLPGYREWLRVLNFGRLSLAVFAAPSRFISMGGIRISRAHSVATYEFLKLSEVASTDGEWLAAASTHELHARSASREGVMA